MVLFNHCCQRVVSLKFFDLHFEFLEISFRGHITLISWSILQDSNHVLFVLYDLPEETVFKMLIKLRVDLWAVW